MAATIGYVHFGGLMGDRVRTDAIRGFLDQSGIPYCDLKLSRFHNGTDIIREMMSPAGLRHLARKAFVDRSHQVTKEINWRFEIQQWERSVSDAVSALVSAGADAEIFHAETLFAGIVCLKAKGLIG